MEIKGRLKTIADMVPDCNVICDVGTDHAYIPIYLVKNKKCTKAIASDVREGPADLARRNIDKYRLSENIEVRVGNGLDTVSENEADVIIIAGMGGMLIKEILEEGFNKAKTSKALILQPMNAIEVVRKWIYRKGFDIHDEGLINEGHKIYNVIVAQWIGKAEEKDEINYYLGEKLVEKKDPLLIEYIERKIKQFETIINEMDKMQDKNKQKRNKYIYLRDSLYAIYNKEK